MIKDIASSCKIFLMKLKESKYSAVLNVKVTLLIIRVGLIAYMGRLLVDSRGKQKSHKIKDHLLQIK